MCGLFCYSLPVASIRWCFFSIVNLQVFTWCHQEAYMKFVKEATTSSPMLPSSDFYAVTQREKTAVWWWVSRGLISPPRGGRFGEWRSFSVVTFEKTFVKKKLSNSCKYKKEPIGESTIMIDVVEVMLGIHTLQIWVMWLCRVIQEFVYMSLASGIYFCLNTAAVVGNATAQGLRPVYSFYPYCTVE